MRSLWLAVLLALALALPASAAVDKGTFTPGAGGAGITLGMTRAQVLAKLGSRFTRTSTATCSTRRRTCSTSTSTEQTGALIGISGPGFCTVFGACALKTGGIAKLRARYGPRLQLTKLPETGEKEWILLGKRGSRQVFTSFAPANKTAASAFIQVFIGYGNGL